MKRFYRQPSPRQPMEVYDVDVPDDTPDPVCIYGRCPLHPESARVEAIDYSDWVYLCSLGAPHALPSRILDCAERVDGKGVAFGWRERSGITPVEFVRVESAS